MLPTKLPELQLHCSLFDRKKLYIALSLSLQKKSSQRFTFHLYIIKFRASLKHFNCWTGPYIIFEVFNDTQYHPVPPVENDSYVLARGPAQIAPIASFVCQYLNALFQK
jgi:hypothetical protein